MYFPKMLISCRDHGSIDVAAFTAYEMICFWFEYLKNCLVYSIMFSLFSWSVIQYWVIEALSNFNILGKDGLYSWTATWYMRFIIILAFNILINSLNNLWVFLVALGIVLNALHFTLKLLRIERFCHPLAMFWLSDTNETSTFPSTFEVPVTSSL